MNDKYKILIVEDNPADVELTKREILQVLKSVEFSDLCTEVALHNALKTFNPDIIISDFSMPGFDGLSVIRITRKEAPLTPVVIFTGSLDEETAAETVKAGATDYVLKGNMVRLRQAVLKAVEIKQMWIEQQEYQEKLRVSEERYRILFEQAADGIFHGDENGNFIGSNTSGIQITGYSKEELVKMSMADFFSKEEIKREPLMYDLLKKGEVVRRERTLTRKDGTFCEIEMNTKMLPDHTYLAIVRDVTLRKQAEKKLRESEERYSNLIKMLPVGIAIHQEGNIIFANETAEQLFEVTPDKTIVGTKILNFLHPDYIDIVAQRIKKSLDKNIKATPKEEVFITFTGKEFPVEATSIPIEFKGAKALLTVFNDISARKKAQKLLIDSEAKYRSFFENTGTATAIIEEDFTISLVNSKFAKLIGVPKKELENKRKWTEFVAPEDLDRMISLHILRRKDPSKALRAYEFSLKDVKGNIRNIMLHVDIIPGTKKSLFSLLDITERKKVEEELRKNRLLLRTMIDSLPIWISAVDLEGNYFIANKYYETFFKRPLALIEGHNFKEIFPEKAYKKQKAFFDECLSSKKTLEIIDELPGDNGAVVYAYGTYTPLFDEQGTLFGMAALAMGITMQKEAEIALKESEEQFRTTFESAPIGMCLNPVDGNFNQVNQSFCDMMGYTQEELQKFHFNDITYPDDIEATKDFVQNLLARKNTSSFIEKRYVRKDGTVIWTITSIAVLRDINDNPRFFIIQVIDITKLKQTEQNLKEAKHQLELVFNNGPDAILLTRIEDGFYVDSNKTFTKYTGYTPDDLRGKSTLGIDIWNDPKDRDTLLHEVQSKGYCHNLELVVKNKNGTFRTIEMSAEVIVIKGIPCLLSISRDIAERKRMEDLLQKQNIELKDLVATKDRFFSIIAHDLKDPHNAILGFSEILSGSYDTLSEQDRKNYIKNILLSSQALARLLQNLLEWAGSQTGKMVYKPEKLNLEKLIQETFDLLHYQAKIKQIRLVSDIDSSSYVFADSNMIKTVLRNLVSNAIKFTRRNGFVKIYTLDVPDGNSNNSFVEISVADNGVGIKKENLPNLFRLDSKIKTQGTEEETGSGLGLILCKELIEKNKGSLNITSEENVGTTVSFTLPQNAIK